MAHDDPATEDTTDTPDPAPPALPPPGNPIEWIRQNRAKAEILAIGFISIGLIFCMMALVAIGLWRAARP
jgi:hypothetical protein